MSGKQTRSGLYTYIYIYIYLLEGAGGCVFVCATHNGVTHTRIEGKEEGGKRVTREREERSLSLSLWALAFPEREGFVFP